VVQTAERLERVLPLEGGRNFRDLGGYPTQDGRRRLRWGKLYRSGSMAALTEAAYAQLADLGVRVVCDLRTTSERETSPVEWRRVPNLSYWARDYDWSFGDLRSLLATGAPSAERAREAMATGYRNLPFEQAPAYAELFRRLVAGDTPLVFNCSAGKDRTGVAAALILSALDVAPETIVEDYLLSNTTLDRTGWTASQLLGRVGEAVVDAILGVDAAYIAAALAAVDERHGSLPRYLHDELGVTERDVQTLQAHLLE
jgi:protein-tyrosine phosphatase